LAKRTPVFLPDIGNKDANFEVKFWVRIPVRNSSSEQRPRLDSNPHTRVRGGWI